jgi:hypothetical protein
MKRLIAAITILLVMASCGGSKTTSAKKPLYEVLTQQEDGGGNIRFFEILSEQKEIIMLQNDEKLKKKIKPDDILSSNFLILNMGEKNTGGYSIGVEKVEETADKIIVTVKETEPAPGSMVTQAITYPYAVVRINSKKDIVVK